jgi:hypothetical protein
MREPDFMKFGMYVLAPEPISTACFSQLTEESLKKNFSLQFLLRNPGDVIERAW